MNPTPKPCLDGPGASDYERYLRTDELFALQTKPGEVAHPDEWLFQTVHQTAELWLLHAARELGEAGVRMEAGESGETARWLGKARDSFACVVASTRMLRHLSPSDYRVFRPRLGNGSGFDSPGFRKLREAAAPWFGRLMTALSAQSITLRDVVADRHAHADWHAIIEHLLDLDHELMAWRHEHFLIVQRLLGPEAIGLKGLPVRQLLERLDHRLFPGLWESRGHADGGDVAG